jgi:tetratricopeptide (TPR) repeat protein
VGRVPEGIALAKDAVASEPKSAAANVLLGRLYLQKGDLPSAIDALSIATKLDPNSAAAHFALGTDRREKSSTNPLLAAAAFDLVHGPTPTAELGSAGTLGRRWTGCAASRLNEVLAAGRRRIPAACSWGKCKRNRREDTGQLGIRLLWVEPTDSREHVVRSKSQCHHANSTRSLVA